MTEITASLVKELREKTNVGMMECKKALKETGGNLEEAVKYLREKGIAAAEKKSDREASEGAIFTAVNGTEGVVVELNCETDFVAKNAEFAEEGQQLTQFVLENSIQSKDELEAATVNGKSFKEFMGEIVLKIGENISVGSVSRLKSSGSLNAYVHMNKKIGVLVAFSGDVEEAVGKDVAMQIAAAEPQYIRPDDVSTDDLDRESEIIRTQLKNEGKPDNLVEQILQGKIKKYYKEVCLLEQAFIKDDKKAVKDILPGNVTVDHFIRSSL